jgi:hypothetical protein
MNLRDLLAPVLVLALLCPPGMAQAQASYDAPTAGVSVVYGGRTDGPPVSDRLVVGGGVFAGWRFLWFRVGLVSRLTQWRSTTRGLAIDSGLFFNFDLGSVWLNSTASVALYARFEPTYRWVQGQADGEILPRLELGVRIAGIEMGIGGAPSFTVGPPPPDHVPPPIGGDVEARLSFDVIELAKIIESQSAANPRNLPN